jgi:hypothetical protein
MRFPDIQRAWIASDAPFASPTDAASRPHPEMQDPDPEKRSRLGGHAQKNGFRGLNLYCLRRCVASCGRAARPRTVVSGWSLGTRSGFGQVMARIRPRSSGSRREGNRRRH